jgi:hypothetical protein
MFLACLMHDLCIYEVCLTQTVVIMELEETVICNSIAALCILFCVLFLARFFVTVNVHTSDVIGMFSSRSWLCITA